MSKARNLARLVVDTGGDVDVSSLGNVPPSNDASALTTGTLSMDRVAAGSITPEKIAAGAIPSIPEVITPTNASPTSGATGQIKYPTLTSGAFYSLYGFSHTHSQWQVSSSSDFSAPLVDTGDVTSTTSYSLTTGLSVSSTYYWRVRHKNSRGVYSAWSTPTSFTTKASFDLAIAYLVVAGGGGGFGGQAISYAGTGGAGGGVSQVANTTIYSGAPFAVVIGAGGASRTVGNNSSFNGSTATGGAAGYITGATGGPTNPGVAPGLTQASLNSVYYSEGGHGAAGVWGTDGVYCPPQGIGGCCGTRGGLTPGQPGLVNRGGGGGSGGVVDGGTAPLGGAGGSGVVIIRYAGAPQASGGTITQSGGYTYHTFTASGNFVF